MPPFRKVPSGDTTREAGANHRLTNTVDRFTAMCLAQWHKKYSWRYVVYFMGL